MRSSRWCACHLPARGLRAIGLSTLLVLAGLGLVLAFGRASVAAQPSDTECTQSALQSALSAGQSTITFAPNCTIKLTSSLTVGSGATITIEGNGLVLDGGSGGFGAGQQVVGTISINDSKSSPSTLALDDVTVNGSVLDNNQFATIRLVGSTITGTRIYPYGGVGVVAGTIMATNSTIGAYIGASGPVTMNNSTVDDYITGSSVSMTDSVVSGCDVHLLTGVNATKSVTVIDSTFGGGGCSGSPIFAGTDATVTGSLVGSISVGTTSSQSFTDSGTVATVSNSTVIGGIQAGSATVTSSTVSGTISTDSATLTANILNGPGGYSPHCEVQSLTDGGYNLSPDASCHLHSIGSKNNVRSTALDLLPLGSYGGPTQTVALGNSSVAIDAIPVVNGKCAVGTQTDQRGVSRPQGSACDIGAFELVPNSIVYFPQTGSTLSNGFLAFWQHFGGLAVFGYPISNEFQQNGVTVQYFQRARFEWHPGSDPARYDVELGLLGDEAAVTARQQIPAPFAPIQAASDANCTFYQVTGHRLCFGFRAYWESHGGLANFGYPISEEFKDPTTGLTVQYFERAVFEYHPNNPVAYQVELRLLGTQQLEPQP